MARLARLTFIGYPHHVIQRGNYDQPVFESDDDYRQYLSWLQHYTSHYFVDIWAYCLMPNHVHFICVPRAEDALSRAFNALHMRYAQFFNGKRSLRGHLWRPRFMSCVLDDSSVREEIRFIENNPVRGGLVARPDDYPWSSARHHILGVPDPVVTDGCFLHNEIKDWRGYLEEKADESILGRTWQSLKTGRPAGDVSSIHALEEIVGRRLRAFPKGRPRKG